MCAGEGNTIVSHFVVQRADLIVALLLAARAVLLSMRASEDFGCAENCLCTIKPDCCSLRPASFSYLCVRVRILGVLKIVCVQ